MSIAPPRPAPRRPGLIPTEIADALSGVLGKATTAIRAHEAGSRAGGNIENVHQMRVATRRIRAYLKAAQPALDPAVAGGLRADLSALAGALGAVRDLDVMIERLHAEAAALGEPDTAALEVLITALDTERRVARAALVEQLEQPGYQALLAELEATAKKPPVTDPWADLAALGARGVREAGPGPAKVGSNLWRQPTGRRPARAPHPGQAGSLCGRTPTEIAAMTTFLAALAQFQEILGDHQDASVLEDQLRAMIATSGDAAAAIAVGRIVEGGRQRKRAARDAYPAAWAAVEAAARAAYPPAATR